MADTLPKEHVFQAENDQNCGPCCLQMIYSLKGKKRTVKEILADFHFEEKGRSTYPGQIARDLLRHGIRTKLTIANPRVISPAWVGKSRAELIELLKLWATLQDKHEWHLYGLHLLFYLQEGVEVVLKPIGQEDLQQMVDRQSLLILALDEVWLWGHRYKSKKAEIDDLGGKTQGHFILVKSRKGDNFSVYDPYPTIQPDVNGEYEVDGKKLLNALLTWSATIIEVLA